MHGNRLFAVCLGAGLLAPWAGSSTRLNAAEPEPEPKPLRTVPVGTVAELEQALEGARPGDLIRAADGDYRTRRTLTVRKSGSAERPIVVRAAQRGKARITGQAGVVIREAAYVVLEGFVFAEEAAEPALRLLGCHHVRVTRNQFRLQESAPVRTHWLDISGQGSHHNRLDHNLFEEKRNSGCFVVTGGSREPDFLSSQYDRIDHNHFRNRPHGTENGYEGIRLGVGSLAHSSGFATVEYNLFERCDGEAEIVSVKTCDQTIRCNTFRDCYGMLTFRNGDRNRAEGNFFLATAGRRGSQGIRIYGDDHRIVNNYFSGLDGAAILLLSGDLESPRKPVHLGGPAGGYLRPHRALIAFNTASDCRGGFLRIGDTRPEYPLQPTDCTIANNLAIGKAGPLVVLRAPATDLKWRGNLFFPTGPDASVGLDLPPEAIRVIDPRLVVDGSLLRLSPDSPARDAAVGSFPEITTDMDGQTRDSKPDVGADEYSTLPVVRRPLVAADVGIDAP